MPKDKAVHIILDNYATHKQPKVRAWLARHPRWTFHFVPTSCSWLNAVEGFFAKVTRRRLKNGVFHSVVDLQAAINRQSRSCGKQTLTTSSQPSDVGTKCWNQCTSIGHGTLGWTTGAGSGKRAARHAFRSKRACRCVKRKRSVERCSLLRMTTTNSHESPAPPLRLGGRLIESFQFFPTSDCCS